jgi:hypothetical protein
LREERERGMMRDLGRGAAEGYGGGPEEGKMKK